MDKKLEQMSVKAYAEMRKLQPQLVHYYIRKGDIKQFPCACCGCKVINVAEADKTFVKSGEEQ